MKAFSILRVSGECSFIPLRQVSNREWKFAEIRPEVEGSKQCQSDSEVGDELLVPRWQPDNNGRC